jgi:hypothetical protein
VSIAPGLHPHPTHHPTVSCSKQPCTISSVVLTHRQNVRIQQWAMRCYEATAPGKIKLSLQGWGRKRAVVEVVRRSVVSAIPCNCQAVPDRALVELYHSIICSH